MDFHPYLSFDGTCEAALTFYAQVFRGEISSLNRYEGSPMEAQVPPEWKSKIMHGALVAPGITFFASDSSQFASGDRISLSLSTKDANEGKRVFDALAEGGSIEMPLSDVFWGGSFGMVVDRFGIRWMMSC
jgi:PhnB protein